MMCFSLFVNAKLTIEITQGIDNPTPLAVSPFSWSGEGKLSEDIASIVESDLSRTGMFTLLSRADMLSHPDLPQEVYYRDWRALHQDYLLIANIEPVASQFGKIRIHYYLYDIYRQKVLLSKKLVSSTSGLRDLAHKISDQVFEKITNIRGAFSTKIIYISSSTNTKGHETYRLWVADADGARAKIILESKEPIVSPSWSPDGKQVTYVSFESRRPAIYRQTIASGKREKLTNFEGLNGSPSWSPDGSKIAMVFVKRWQPQYLCYGLIDKKTYYARVSPVCHRY